MNEKEISEIRRRYRTGKNNITTLRGCYVNETREIVSEFNQSLHLTDQEEAESILTILRKTLSGGHGKNLIDISFDTSQVVDSEEHRLLMSLRDTQLKNDDVVSVFYSKVIKTLNLEGGYLILLTHDTYDVMYHSSNGDKLEDASSEIFSYILCSICPIKITKPALSYYIYENKFQNKTSDWLVASPELGFMFPAFDERSSNIYNALYYTRNISKTYSEFIETIFKSEIPMPAAIQKDTFQSILTESLTDDCSYKVVQSIHDQLCEMIEEHKTNKEEEPLRISKSGLKSVLEYSGVPQSRLEPFEEKYNSEFGEDKTLSPKNIVDSNVLEVRTPDVTIQVKSERKDLIETRVIDGAKYILIRAGEDVAVNGININIK